MEVIFHKPGGYQWGNEYGEWFADFHKFHDEKVWQN